MHSLLLPAWLSAKALTAVCLTLKENYVVPVFFCFMFFFIESSDGAGLGLLSK